MSRDEYDRLVHTTDSVIHCAASLNRKSEKSCLNVNLRGTLEVLKLARHAEHYHGLRRFSDVSTVAVAGKRSNEVVTEDRSIEWDRSDYDPYARTKKFCEHMIRVLLPDTPKTIFRPSIVLGDSRRAETTQFDMVKAFVFLAGLPALPFRPNDKIDIVNVDFVADAIATLHQKDRAAVRHLPSVVRHVVADLPRVDRRAGGGPAQAQAGVYSLYREAVRWLGEFPVQSQRADRPRRCAAESFMPYLVWNTVFDNTRVTSELGRKPVPFSQYSFPLLKFSRENNFEYHYQPWPAARGRNRRMMDLVLEAWVSGNIERAKARWMLGGKRALAARREAQAVCSPDTTARATWVPTCASKRCCARCATFWARTVSSSA